MGGGGYQGGQGLHDQDVSMLQLGLVEGLALVHLLHHHLGLKLHLLCHLHPSTQSSLPIQPIVTCSLTHLMTMIKFTLSSS